MAEYFLAGSDDFREVGTLTAISGFYPYRYIKGKEKEARTLWLEDIASSHAGPGARALFVREGGTLEGFALIEPLPWDSRVFGRKMGAITHMDFAEGAAERNALSFSSFLLERARDLGYEFLLAKCFTDNVGVVHLLEEAGFKLVDTLLDYVWEKGPFPLTAEERLAGGFEICPADAADEQELREIAGRAFGGHFGRYHSDPRIPRELANGVYMEWISSSLKGYADHFLVAKYNGEIAGYSIWKDQSAREKRFGLDLGHYSIAGINPKYKGKGLFTLLTLEGMRILEKEHAIIEGPTHINNYPVQRGYAKLGWRIADARHSFHRWIGG